MKRITTYLLAALLLIAAGCDDNIPKTGTVNNALVQQVIFDDVLAEGLVITVGSTYSLPEHISALPIDATNTAQRYESSDPSTADVSEQGVLTAKKIGNCIITVYIGMDGICNEFPVYVEELPYIHISSLRFNASEAEYDIESGTVNMKNILYIGSESQTEDATEPVLFSSSDEDVATIDANGILTILKLGETTITASAEESEVEAAVINLKFYRWMEYERFPGDKEGKQREIMGSSANEWNADHTDGGWLFYFGFESDASKTWNAGLAQRNCYRYACLDGRLIVARVNGVANDLPTATNGTAMAYARPGGSTNNAESDNIWFTIDMREAKQVDYFRFVNISNNKDDSGVFVTGISEILGSNDNQNWTSIATDIRDFQPRTADANGATVTVNRESDIVLMHPETDFQYIKFILRQKDKCIGYYKLDGSQDRAGGNPQIDEIYLGAKLYTE